jgi:hypothetical protein
MNKLNIEVIPQFDLYNTTFLKLYLEYIGHGFTKRYNKITIGKYIREHCQHMPFMYECLISHHFSNDFMTSLCKTHTHKQKLLQTLTSLIHIV